MNRLILFFGLIFYSLASLFSQPISLKVLPNPLPEPAIKNELNFPGDNIGFFSLFEKLDSLVFKGIGEVNIVHIGGSHVQAGLLTDAIRFKLQTMSPGLTGERGFFFPFALAHTNSPNTYKTNAYPNINNWHGQRCSVPSHTGPWGVSGIRAWTTDSTSRVEIYSKDDPFGYRELRILASPSDSSLVVRFLNSTDSSFYDSSINAFVGLFSIPQDTISFRLASENIKQKYFSLEGVQVIRETPGLRYHAIGANGAATHSYLKCDRFGQQMAAINPDLILFGLGINDAYKSKGRFDSLAYENNYDSLVGLIRQVNPKCAFIFLTNNDSYYRGKYNPHGEIVRRSMFRLAKKHKGSVHDLYNLMGGKNSVSFWIRKGWAKKDGIHMTRIGYGLQAYWLANAIESAYLDIHESGMNEKPMFTDKFQL